MSAVAMTGPLGITDQLVLRWSEYPEFPIREEPVQMVRSQLSESVVRSSLSVSEKTQVHLIGKYYTGIGIVQSCRSDGNAFVLTILMTADHSLPELATKPDPGVFAVDEFLTEEDELRILQSLSNGA